MCMNLPRADSHPALELAHLVGGQTHKTRLTLQFAKKFAALRKAALGCDIEYSILARKLS